VSATPVVRDAETPPHGTAPVRQQHEPKNLPSWAEMVLAVLEEGSVSEGLRPREITAAVRRRWWPDAKPAASPLPLGRWSTRDSWKTTAAAIGSTVMETSSRLTALE
jgi:hypothetical protein